MPAIELDEDDLSAFVDDILLPDAYISMVRKKLKHNGFDVKEPTPLYGSRALGLEVDKSGIWRRRGEFPTLEERTRKGMTSWTGSAVAHQPVAGWLRPAIAKLMRKK